MKLICRLDQWNDRLCERFYNRNTKPGGYLHQASNNNHCYTYWRNCMLKGYKFECAVAKALLEKGCTVEWVNPYHDCLIELTQDEVEQDKLNHKPNFDVWVTFPNGDRYSIDIKSCHSDEVIYGRGCPWGPTTPEFLMKYVFHNAQYLITITESGQLKGADLSCFIGVDPLGRSMFTTKPLKVI